MLNDVDSFIGSANEHRQSHSGPCMRPPWQCFRCLGNPGAPRLTLGVCNFRRRVTFFFYYYFTSGMISKSYQYVAHSILGHAISSVLFHKIPCRIGKNLCSSFAGVGVRSTENMEALAQNITASNGCARVWEGTAAA